MLPWARLRRRTEQEAALTSQPYITCQELIDFIASYLDNELPTTQRAEFERHLTVCPSCQAYLATYRKTVALAKASARDSTPTDVPEALVQAILSARRRE